MSDPRPANRDTRTLGLRLLVAGGAFRSTLGVPNLKRSLENRLSREHALEPSLEVVDICRQPELARGEDRKTAPGARKKIIGDSSDEDRLCDVLLEGVGGHG